MGKASAGALLLPSGTFFLAIFFFLLQLGEGRCSEEAANLGRRKPPSPDDGLCARLIRPLGYPCTEHTVQTTDGFLLTIQHISHGKRTSKAGAGRPVFLQHGLFQGGDTWFLNSVEESLGFILADSGFDVWVGNVRGTRWSLGHISLPEYKRDFWDWSWQDLAEYDLRNMINYVYSITNSKVFFVGHSQGTIMGLAALTIPDIAEMIEAAALLCPIAYLNHITAPLVMRAVKMHLDQMLLTMGIHQLNFRSEAGVHVLDSLCDGHMDCTNILSSITGRNCCFNGSRVDYYLEYEPHPSSVKNINHLFQMIRKDTFAKYDYGFWGNLRRYGYVHPPAYDLASIPDSLPLWMAYGGNDALADVTDVQRAIKGLRADPKLVYLDAYGHIDFIYSMHAKSDVYDKMIEFLSSWGQALPYVRCVGESWPMTKDRAYFESLALKEHGRLCPNNVPEVYHFDRAMSSIGMRYLKPPHIILRKGLIAGIEYPLLAEHMSEFMARTLFFTSLLYHSTLEHKRAVAEFCGNELCRLTEQVVFSDPYMVSQYNHWTSPFLDKDAEAIREDDGLKLEIARLKSIFCERAQALIHGDLHTGSVMVTSDSTQVIDPEFAFYGPMGFDLGAFLGNLILAFFAQDGHANEENNRKHYKSWILGIIEDTWNLFHKKFLSLWNQHRDGQGEAYLFSIYSKPELCQRAQQIYMRDLFHDSLGFGAAKMIRRIVGIAHVEDFESIQDNSIRAHCERQALNFAKMLLKQRHQFSTINEITAALQSI